MTRQIGAWERDIRQTNILLSPAFDTRRINSLPIKCYFWPANCFGETHPASFLQEYLVFVWIRVMETNSTNAVPQCDNNVEIKQEHETLGPSGNTRSLDGCLSNNTLPIRPPRHTVTAEARYTSEPVDLPPHLKALLESWHEEKGGELPPCRYKHHTGPMLSKAYDREGREVKLTEFTIKTPVSYGVLAAFFHDHSFKLVSSVFPGRRKYGSYYEAWLGAEEGFDSEACIIRHFSNRRDKLEYQPEAWKEWEALLKKEQRRSTGQAAAPSPLSRLRKRTATQGSISVKSTKRHQPERRENASSDRGSTATSEDDDDEEETDDSDNDSGEEESDAEGIQKRSDQSSRNNGPPPNSPRGPELRFKLTFFRFRVPNVRQFPLEECRTGKELFKKAHAFYSIFDDTIKVQVLSCQIASRPEQHYIFAGNEGEFDLLVRHAQNFAKDLEKPLTIEVGLAQS